MKTINPRTARAGFSLIEVVIVMTILTIMAGVVVPVASRAIDREAKKQTLNEMRGLDAAVREYFRDTGALPTGAASLIVDDALAGWSGPYVTGGIRLASGSGTDFDEDGWGVAYALDVTGDVWTLRSAGPNRTMNDTDDLILEVDVTAERRDLTIERLQVINLAIRLYNDDWLSPPLPATPDPLSLSWPTAFTQLVTRGYLPNSAEYQSDGWGADFQAVGGSTPVVSVTSLNLGI